MELDVPFPTLQAMLDTQERQGSLGMPSIRHTRHREIGLGQSQQNTLDSCEHDNTRDNSFILLQDYIPVIDKMRIPEPPLPP
jgi:hypothetical protein